MAEFTQIGQTETYQGLNGTKHEAKFLVPEAELADAIPNLGETVSWAEPDCVATAWRKTWLGGGCWQLTITAIPKGDLSEINLRDSDLENRIGKTYSSSEIYLRPEFWGIILASASDEESGLLDIYGDPCKRGSYLFPNSSASNKGAADYRKSPFLESGLDLDVSLIGRTIKTRLYVCVYYTRRPIHSLADFIGVSGSFPSKCRPKDSQAGRWLALNQRLQNHFDKDNQAWTKVYRKMLLAPASCCWDPDKNGGTWTW
ncbi:MAG: hypothetical protein A2X49_06615 [Lentisphaerae bacterium GWF2_52_8]|nr:MAG: hypothetical protein A2X49_06615 [Lentisphaerae bacterium GWF2_52_8]